MIIIKTSGQSFYGNWNHSGHFKRRWIHNNVQLASDAVGCWLHSYNIIRMIAFRKRRLIEEQKNDFRNLFRCLLSKQQKITKNEMLPLAHNLCIYLQSYNIYWFARLPDVVNTLFSVFLLRFNLMSRMIWNPVFHGVQNMKKYSDTEVLAKQVGQWIMCIHTYNVSKLLCVCVRVCVCTCVNV